MNDYGLNSVIALVFMGIGILFNLFGCLGLLRFPDVYNRLQSATKCVTLGTCSILVGLAFHFGLLGSVGWKALLAVPLIFIAATVAAHALARGAYIFGIKLWDKSVIDDYKDDLK